MSEVVIVSAARTPVGAFNGAFANTPAHELGKVAIAAALERAKVDPARSTRSSSGRCSRPARVRTRLGRLPWRPASQPKRPLGR